MQAHPALVLNADFRPLSYFPLSLLSWQDAITAVFKDHVSVVAEYDKWVSSPSTKLRLPSVVALRDYIPMPKRVAFTRFNVFLRDRFRCQYCGEMFSAKDLTFEHVVPRSKGGETTWTNIVGGVRLVQRQEGQQARYEAHSGARRADTRRAPRGEAMLPAELFARVMA
jgi:hypothetical protein